MVPTASRVDLLGRVVDVSKEVRISEKSVSKWKGARTHCLVHTLQHALRTARAFTVRQRIGCTVCIEDASGYSVFVGVSSRNEGSFSCVVGDVIVLEGMLARSPEGCIRVEAYKDRVEVRAIDAAHVNALSLSLSNAASATHPTQPPLEPPCTPPPTRSNTRARVPMTAGEPNNPRSMPVSRVVFATANGVFGTAAAS